MANYSYIRLRIVDFPGASKGRVASFGAILGRAVLKALDARWHVALASFEDGGPTWIVSLPGTAEDFAEGMVCTPSGRAAGEDIGFTVSIHDRAIAFRHGLPGFERWAQGRVAEELADFYGRGVYFDATGRTFPPKTRIYRTGKTYSDYLRRGLPKDVPPSDQVWLERFKATTPAGHW